MNDAPRYGGGVPCGRYCTFLGSYVDPLTERGYDLYVHEMSGLTDYRAVNRVDPLLPEPSDVERVAGYSPAEAILLRLHHPCREAYGRHIILQQQKRKAQP